MKNAIWLFLFLNAYFGITQPKPDTTAVRDLQLKSKTFTHNYVDSLYYYASRSLELAKSLNDQKGIAMALNSIGGYYWIKGDLEQSILYYQDALAINKNLRSNDRIIQNFINLGMAFSRLGDYGTSIDYYHKAQEILDTNRNPSTFFTLYNSLSVLHKNMENLDEAMRYNQLAIEVSKETDDLSNLAGAYTNRGTILKKLGRYDEARQNHNKALQLFESIDATRGEVTVLTNLAELERSIGNYNSAIEHCLKSIEICRINNYGINEVESLIGLAEGYYANRDYINSFRTYQIAFELARKEKYQTKLVVIYLGLANSSFKQKKFEIASNFFQDHIHLKDSIYNDNTVRTIANTRISYEVKKNIREKELMQKEHEIDVLKKNLIITYISVAFVFFLTTAVIIWKRNSYKSKRNHERSQLTAAVHELTMAHLRNKQLKELDLKKELEYRNRELTSYTLNLLQKNETMQKIREELKRLPENTPNELRKIAKSLLSETHFSFQQDKEWESFKKYFDRAHGGFLDKLASIAPHLSPSDRKLVALLRLDLYPEQIATIIGVSVDSIRVSRHRLKKKLNVNSEEDLQTFLANLESPGMPQPIGPVEQA
jgi:tetratricopeptide (TPR) repeat protein